MPQAIGPANVKVCGFYFLMILLFLGQSFLANPSGYKSWFHTLVLMIGQVDKEIHMLVQINNECYMVFLVLDFDISLFS